MRDLPGRIQPGPYLTYGGARAQRAFARRELGARYEFGQRLIDLGMSQENDIRVATTPDLDGLTETLSAAFKTDPCGAGLSRSAKT